MPPSHRNKDDLTWFHMVLKQLKCIGPSDRVAVIDRKVAYDISKKR